MPHLPVIGIILDQPPKPHEDGFPRYSIKDNYANAVNDSGGIPIFLPYCNSILENLTDLVDGVIIPGSSFDVPPKKYNVEHLHTKTVINEDKTNFDLKILEIVKANNIPFLGICYGMQLLNVFFGGSLIQHIPDEINSSINHQPDNDQYIPSHNINITAGTILLELANDQAQILVNSNHHQSVKDLGKGLILSAMTEDTVIEAIESPEYNFMLGIEWHPEYLKTLPLDKNIFKKFIEAAKNYGFNK